MPRYERRELLFKTSIIIVLIHHSCMPPFPLTHSHFSPFLLLFFLIYRSSQVMILCVGNKTITSTAKRKVHSETRRGLACDSFIRLQTYICFRRKDASRKKICRARHNIFLPFLKLYLLIIYIPRH